MRSTVSVHLREILDKIQELHSNRDELPLQRDDFLREASINGNEKKVVLFRFEMPPGRQAVHGYRLFLERNLQFMERARESGEVILRTRVELAYLKSDLEDWAMGQQSRYVTEAYRGLPREYVVGTAWQMLVVANRAKFVKHLLTQRGFQNGP